MWRHVILLSLLVLPWHANAELRHYVASLEQSQWRISTSSPLQCTLEHDIPAYGKAVFTSTSGKEMNLQFTLDMWQKPDAVTDAKLLSKAPAWRPGEMSRTLMNLHYKRYFNGEVPKKTAWAMLNELERGMEPTFYYRDWNDSVSNVAVGLSAVNFQQEYVQFRQCMAGLLPYGFDDIAFTVLNFKEGTSELTKYSQMQLKRVEAYLQYDKNIELVLIDGYADSYGSKNVNKRVSIQRAEQLKDILVQQGIPSERIQTAGHGEDRHVASNITSDQRTVNRRVVIRMSKDVE
ncbi:OmpA family protein [Shewanella avicenniae]|uniref:OmpA family protein n=1 Tax=Shewanella avicenniae TaxID=2814294 RepID=A0ABX7QKS4_9GAMM|nr:OmpA family protein [Shewanella avicenniae]QSX32057.1 OmpA family protein [Shewanella avicenniae]